MIQQRTLDTRARLIDAAIRLFEQQGFERTTVAQIAEAAGVTPMTFFRHFPSKEVVLVTDPYDPMIAEAVAAQPISWSPVERVRRGLLVALDEIDDAEIATVRRRVALIAATPSLRGNIYQNNAATEHAIASALQPGGTAPFESRVAASVCLAAMTTALLDWATRDDDSRLVDVARRALAVLAVPPSGSR